MPDDEAHWISALEARHLVQHLLQENESEAASVLVRWAAGALVESRCRLLRQWDDDDAANVTTHANCGVREQFWHQFGELDQAAGSNWKAGDFKISWYHQREWRNTQLLGVEFRESQIRETAPHLEEESQTPQPQPEAEVFIPSKGGRPPKPWWDDLWAEIAAQIYVGDLTPDRQVKIEQAMLEWAEAKGEKLSEPTARLAARKVMQAIALKDKNRSA